MGQKVNPTGLRLGINRTWDSRWYAGKKEYGKLLQEDIKIRHHLSDRLKQAGVSRVVIERPHKKCRITIHSARPGVVIGKKGADIEKLRSDVQKFTADEVHLNIVEIRKPILRIRSARYYHGYAGHVVNESELDQSVAVAIATACLRALRRRCRCPALAFRTRRNG